MLKELIKAHKIISIHTNFQVNHVNLIDTISKNYINLTIHEKNMVDKIPIEELASKSDKSNLEINLSKAFSKDDLIESDDIDSFLENKRQ
jgi:hypothetical protein